MARSPTPSARRPAYPWVFNVWNTFRLVFSLIRDPRVSRFRRFSFFGIVAGLVAIVLIPSNPIAALLAAVIPVVGPIIGLPADFVLDWTVAAAIITLLLHIFPQSIVAEHRARLAGTSPAR